MDFQFCNLNVVGFLGGGTAWCRDGRIFFFTEFWTFKHRKNTTDYGNFSFIAEHLQSMVILSKHHFLGTFIAMTGNVAWCLWWLQIRELRSFGGQQVLTETLEELMQEWQHGKNLKFTFKLTVFYLWCVMYLQHCFPNLHVFSTKINIYSIFFFYCPANIDAIKMFCRHFCIFNIIPHVKRK